jgi:PAS domain-containing protein
MSEKRLEIILTRLLAVHLATPILVVDAVGTLLFFNEAAEALLGKPFDATGKLPASAWGQILAPTPTDGAPLKNQQLPLLIALAKQRAVQRAFWIRGMDGKERFVEVTVIPLIGLGDTPLGALATLCEAEP